MGPSFVTWITAVPLTPAPVVRIKLTALPTFRGEKITTGGEGFREPPDSLEIKKIQLSNRIDDI